VSFLFWKKTNSKNSTNAFQKLIFSFARSLNRVSSMRSEFYLHLY
jgi:hypothetical protein